MERAPAAACSSLPGEAVVRNAMWRCCRWRATFLISLNRLRFAQSKS